MKYSVGELLNKKESHILDRKSARKDPKGFLNYIVAFANADGNTLVIGFEDNLTNWQNKSFIVNRNGREEMRGAAILLFDKNPQQFFSEPECDLSDMREHQQRLAHTFY